MRQDRLLLTLLAFVTLNTLLTSPLFDVELPIYARHVFGSAVALGLMSAGYGAGSLASSFLYGAIGGWMSRRLVLIASVGLSGLMIGLLTLEPSLPLAALTLGLIGFAAGPVGPLYQTVTQERVPVEMRGRVFGLSGVTFIAMPLGVLGAGFLIQGFGVRTVLGLQSAAVLVAALILAVTPALRAADSQSQSEDGASPGSSDSSRQTNEMTLRDERLAREVQPAPATAAFGQDRHTSRSIGHVAERHSAPPTASVPRRQLLTSQTRGNWLDEAIHRAEAEGQFHNLPGAGKPLAQTNPYEALDESAMAHHILKQSGFLPDWLQLRKEVAEEKPMVVAALEEYRRQRELLDDSDPAKTSTLRRLADRYMTLPRRSTRRSTSTTRGGRAPCRNWSAFKSVRSSGTDQ